MKGELSEGQRYRFRLAQMLGSGKSFWLRDEFCSLLDRTTARIVAYNMQKQAMRVGATLVVATSHTDLVADLSPDIRVVKGWGDEVMVSHDEPEDRGCSMGGEVAVEDGPRKDYDKLSYLHYRGSRVVFPYKFFRMTHRSEVVGVIVYTNSVMRTQGRREAVGYFPDVGELNRDWCRIDRIIVHPKYRGIGLGSMLIRETLLLQGRGNVELTAVMALYSPFAERAGMRLVKRTEPNTYAVKAIETLRVLGFDPGRMASRVYNLGVMEHVELDQVRVALGMVRGSLLFRRLTRSSSDYRRVAGFKAWLARQDMESLARCVQTLSVLGQEKAYLHWKKN